MSSQKEENFEKASAKFSYFHCKIAKYIRKLFWDVSEESLDTVNL